LLYIYRIQYLYEKIKIKSNLVQLIERRVLLPILPNILFFVLPIVGSKTFLHDVLTRKM
jgi:hypothetical protein